jgi:hypothetical protein
MKYMIAKPDGMMGVDGVFYQIDMSSIPDTLRVVQWKGNTGHEEWTNKPNTTFNDYKKYEAVYNKWIEADNKAKAKKADPYFEMPDDEIKSHKIRLAKVEKEKSRLSGVLVGSNWYPSDLYSRSIYTSALVLERTITYKTLAGVSVSITPIILTAIVSAILDLDLSLNTIEEQHLKDISESKTPKAYDPKTKWPVGYKK